MDEPSTLGTHPPSPAELQAEELRLHHRIATLAESLQAAAQDVDWIHSEICARQQLVTMLRSEEERYRQLVALRQPQVDAIVNQLQRVIDGSSRVTNHWTTAMTIVAIMVGLVVAVLVAVFL